MTPPGDGLLVLVVDDEPAITRALSAALTARGYRARVAMTGQRALDAAAVDDPAAVILDLGLPDVDGIEVLRRLREWSDVPVIVLTAEGADDRKVRALDDGADDYVTKPFSTPELLARLRVALRHHRPGTGPVDESPVLTVGDLVIDVPHHTVTVGGLRLDLTPKEFGFLAVLARHAGKVLTHRMILQEVWGPEYGTESEYLRVYASQLRKKLAEDPARPRLVTEPGVGYRLIDRDVPGA
ncbi:MAG TPA: response regulator transcription factor [Acidimicrobiales bacterium]|nr:response regulator transcription factor [Acidimicrobiales bacterium]